MQRTDRQPAELCLGVMLYHLLEIAEGNTCHLFNIFFIDILIQGA